MNSNLKKLFGFATIAACTFGFAMNVNAATEGTDYEISVNESTKVSTCVALTQDGFVECLGHKNVDNIEIGAPARTATADVTAREAVNVKAEVYNTKTYSFKGDVKLVGTSSLDVYGKLTVGSITGGATSEVNVKGGTLNVDGTEKDGITNSVVTLGEEGKKTSTGILNISSNNATKNSDNTLNALNGTEINAYGKSQVKITSGDATAKVVLDNSARFEAKNTKVQLSSGSEVLDASHFEAEEVSGTFTVDGEEASAEYVKSTASMTLTKGTARSKEPVAGTESDYVVLVQTAGLDKVSLASNEKYEIRDVTKDIEITAANGAVIVNETGKDTITVSVNGKDVEISSDEELVVSNGTTTPTEPTEPTDPTKPEDPNKPNTGDDQPNKNPQTFDGILSYVGVALSSVGGLGVSLKKRLFR